MSASGRSGSRDVDADFVFWLGRYFEHRTEQARRTLPLTAGRNADRLAGSRYGMGSRAAHNPLNYESRFGLLSSVDRRAGLGRGRRRGRASGYAEASPTTRAPGSCSPSPDQCK
jgi:hypothetical protein